MVSKNGSGSAKWAGSNATYVVGQSYVDEMDKAAIDVEAKWGAGRARLLVGPELRAKFDRQREMTNAAIWGGELEDVRRETARMVSAWRALGRECDALGPFARLSPAVWEATLSTGEVIALVRSVDDMQYVKPEGRSMQVWSLEEIARLIEAWPPALQAVKKAFTGQPVTRVRMTLDDPLDAVDASARGCEPAACPPARAPAGGERDDGF